MNLDKPIASGVSVENVSPTELYNVLADACSQDTVRLQRSSKRLKLMFDMFGTYDALQEIATQRALPLVIRQQAMIQFKNSALGHWKSRKVLSDDHRLRIRARCLALLDEEDETIAELNELVVAKVARHDYPANWPTLVNDLVFVIDSNLRRRYVLNEDNPHDKLTLRRSLKMLNGLLKEFASLKMPAGMKVMATIVEQLRPVLYGFYSTMAANFTTTTVTPQNINTTRVHDDILLAHLVFKCLVKMALWAWNRLDKISAEDHNRYLAWIRDLFQNSAVQSKTLLELRRTIILALMQSGVGESSFPSRSIDVLNRHIRLFGKFFRRLQQLSHVQFSALPMCGDLILFYWAQVVEATSGPPDLISDSPNAIYPSRFLVQGMVLFKENLSQWTPLRKDGTTNKNSLSLEFVQNAVRLLVTRFMPLKPADLERWLADPEEWVNVEDKENDQWEFEIRPCSERVLMQLSNQFSSFVTPLLQETFAQVAPVKATDLSAVIQKEALYCAVGRCAIRLKGQIPFEEWLQHTLLSEALETNSNYPIIKRRIAWLIGKWVSDECASPNNSNIWQILVHLLEDRGLGTDGVVRLTAAVALRECIDSLAFDPVSLEPFLPTAVSQLVRLIGEAETLESKRRVDGSLIALIEQVGDRITPFIGTITEPLPELWTEAENDFLFKGSLLVTVTKLIESIKGHSTALGNIIVPLVRESLVPAASTNLDEDGMDLWSAALRNTLTISSINGNPALSELIPQALSFLASNLDLLGRTINIIESYLLLDVHGLLQTYGTQLFQCFRSALQSAAVVTNRKDMIGSLNLLIQLAPSAEWGEPMHTSGLFAYLLSYITEGEGPTILLTETIYFFARLAVVDRQIFLQLMSATALSLNREESALYETLLDQWWGKFDNMSEPRFRKLTAMGIASLVSTGRSEVLQRLHGEIFNLWLDVFGEIKESHTDSSPQHDGSDNSPIASPSLVRFWELDEAPSSYYQDTEGTAEYDRRKAVYDRDPIRTTKLNAYVASHIREAEATTGSSFQTYLSEADPTVLKQIQNELANV